MSLLGRISYEKIFFEEILNFGMVFINYNGQRKFWLDAVIWLESFRRAWYFLPVFDQDTLRKIVFAMVRCKLTANTLNLNGSIWLGMRASFWTVW